MMPGLESAALDESALRWFATGLGLAFIVSCALVVAFMRWSKIDHGMLGLMLLLIVICFLVAYSFLIAASTQGIDIKIAVVVVDALVLIGSKLLTPPFLDYLKS